MMRSSEGSGFGWSSPCAVDLSIVELSAAAVLPTVCFPATGLSIVSASVVRASLGRVPVRGGT